MYKLQTVDDLDIFHWDAQTGMGPKGSTVGVFCATNRQVVRTRTTQSNATM